MASNKRVLILVDNSVASRRGEGRRVSPVTCPAESVGEQSWGQRAALGSLGGMLGTWPWASGCVETHACAAPGEVILG